MKSVMVGLALALALAACGSDGEPSGGAPAATPAPPDETSKPAPRGETPPAAAETVAERPGCGELCQNAGPPAGTDNPGCPGNDSDNCAPCPEGGCAALLTESADVHDGIFTVRMRCNADQRCVGAFHAYVPMTISSPIAASDVSVPAGRSAEVAIALTSFGRHVVAVTGRFRGSVYVFLEGTGVDQLESRDFTAPTLSLSSARERFVACGGDIEVAANTSCPFARKVFAMYASGRAAGRVRSPTTGRSYEMSCSSDATAVYCGGGDDAFLTFPQRVAELGE